MNFVLGYLLLNTFLFATFVVSLFIAYKLGYLEKCLSLGLKTFMKRDLNPVISMFSSIQHRPTLRKIGQSYIVECLHNGEEKNIIVPYSALAVDSGRENVLMIKNRAGKVLELQVVPGSLPMVTPRQLESEVTIIKRSGEIIIVEHDEIIAKKFL